MSNYISSNIIIYNFISKSILSMFLLILSASALILSASVLVLRDVRCVSYAARRDVAHCTQCFVLLEEV